MSCRVCYKAITLLGFNDLERSVTLIFLSMGHFLYRFYTFCRNEENLWSGSLNFLQNTPSNLVHLTSLFSFVLVSNASLRVKVCENVVNI